MQNSQPPKPVSRSRAIVYACFGLVTIINLGVAAYQLGWGYFTGQGLDITPSTFLVEAVVFLVVAYYATTQLVHLLAWLGLRRRAKQHIVIAEYSIDEVSPAEAGVMLDTFSGKSELIAMLRGLEAKRQISIAIMPTGAKLTHLDGEVGLSNEEQVLLEELFKGGSALELPADRMKLLQAYNMAENTIAQGLITKGYLPESRQVSLVVSITYKIFGVASFIAQLILFAGLFQVETWQILYPRYPVHAWQLIFVLSLIAIVIVLPLSSYRKERYTPQGWEVYRKTAGLYLYMDVALKQQLRQRELAASELDRLEPYALAFGLVPSHKDALSRYL